VRRPQVGELGEQIAVSPYLVIRHLPVCGDSQEDVTGVVAECPAIAPREGYARRPKRSWKRKWGRRWSG
jgi:hypothetical protein